jgi:hypothetical protein
MFVLWIIGLGVITSKIGSMVLSHACGTQMWMTSMGVMVCRIYKALYSFIVVATVSSGAAVVLDVMVLKESARRGVYKEMKDQSHGQGQEKYEGIRGQSHNQGQGQDQQKYEPYRGQSNALSSSSPAESNLRRGFYMEMKESPDLGGDGEEDDAQRLIGKSPDPSEYSQTPRLS